MWLGLADPGAAADGSRNLWFSSQMKALSAAAAASSLERRAAD
jgi:hypothetical protein